MDLRRQVGRSLLRVGEGVRSSPLLRRALKRTGLAKPVMTVYKRVVARLFDDEVQLDVEGVTATFPSLSPAHLTNELPVLRDFVRQVRRSEGDVWDVGAAVGLFAVPAATVTTGDIHAFEPFPRQYDRLETNVTENDVADTVNLSTVALADERGRRTFDTDEAALSVDGDGHPVEVWPGDELAVERSLPVPSVIKIDVEGAEVAVLDGLEATLRSEDCEAVYVEVHPERLPSFDASTEAVRAKLTDAGFTVSRLASSEDGRYTIKGLDADG